MTTDLPVCLHEAPERCRSAYSFVFGALCWEKIGVTRKAFWDLGCFDVAAVLQDAVKYRLVRYCKIYQHRLVDMTSGLTAKLGILQYGTAHDYTF